MLFLLGGLAILCGLLLLGYLFVNADPARLAQRLKWIKRYPGFVGLKTAKFDSKYRQDDSSGPAEVVGNRRGFGMHRLNYGDNPDCALL